VQRQHAGLGAEAEQRERKGDVAQNGASCTSRMVSKV